MVSVLLLQLLTLDPNESYTKLDPPVLLEKRRMLVEEKPGLAAPLSTISAGALGVLGGAALSVFASQPYGCEYHTGGCYGGIGLAVVGLAAVTFGIVWLINRLTLRSSIAARIDEINDLIDLKRTPAPAG